MHHIVRMRVDGDALAGPEAEIEGRRVADIVKDVLSEVPVFDAV